MAATGSLLSYQFLRKFRVTAYVNIWALICVRTCIQRNFSIRQYLSSSPIKFLLINISKFAPLMQLTIPRLELCAATLLSKLYKKATRALNIPVNESYLWTDSSIVLTWIQGPSNKWKTFVGNRVATIQEETSSATWRHVPSQSNPADLISRGTDPSTLTTSTLWWKGPQWLSQEPSIWPTTVQYSHRSIGGQEGTCSIPTKSRRHHPKIFQAP